VNPPARQATLRVPGDRDPASVNALAHSYAGLYDLRGRPRVRKERGQQRRHRRGRDGSYDGGVTETNAGRPGHRSYPKGVRRRKQILDSAIALFAPRGVDRASLRTIGEAIGVSHTALRHYFASRDELLVETYRTHEARAAGEAHTVSESAVGQIIEAAERNRSIPGLVELYATLTTDALQEQHAVTREFIRGRFDSLRKLLAARIEAGQQAGRIAADINPVDSAALVIAASDGLQIQWLLDPDAVDVGRSLSLLERLFPLGAEPGTSA
jgi:AcrR family transcriptional regulator